MVNKKKLISIIVPVYNVEKFLPTCIESIISQTFTDFELIIVNDGSTDSSGLICDLFAKRDSRILVIHQENKGLVGARKSGISVASCKYVLYIDGDDYVEPNFCDLLLKETYNFDADIVIGGYIINYRGRIKKVENVFPVGRYENDDIFKIWDKMIYTGNYFSHGISTYSWGKLFKREILLPIQMSIPSDITIGEDAACVYPYIALSKKIVITNFSNYHYVQHQSSMLKNFSDLDSEIQKISNLFVYMLNVFKTHILFKSFYNQLKPYLLSQLMIRTGGVVKNTKNEIFLLGHKISILENIVIFNSGTFGQKIFNRLTSESFENITWIDDDADLCNQDGLKVEDPKVLNKIKVDKLFIASFNPIYINKILNQYNFIDYKKIYYFQLTTNKNIEKLISAYDVNPENFLKLN